jgi:hypothetical protein
VRIATITTALLLAACTRSAPAGPAPAPPPSAASAASAASATTPVTSTTTAPQASPAPAAPPADAPRPSRTPPLGASAEAALFGDDDRAARERACPTTTPARDRVLCLVDLRYAADPQAQRMAHELYEDYGVLAGVEADHYESMAWRGRIHIVPEPPAGKHRKHLAWLHAAMHDYDTLFKALAPDAGPAVRFEWHPLAVRFMRSVDRTTPSAYAAFDAWVLAYNVVGSLNTSEDAVRELFFHELFHRNDGDHEHWSERVLKPIFDTIVAKCGTKMACLAPYAPTTTTVRGGTYYAFQPEDYDPVHEYAAELAIRWYREHRAILKKLPRVAPFKCGPPENARAWRLIAGEFFGGIDLVPACS